jgi:hypothetical protein
MPATSADTFSPAAHPGPPGTVTLRLGQLGQAGLLTQRHDRYQPAGRHKTRIIEHRVPHRSDMR